MIQREREREREREIERERERVCVGGVEPFTYEKKNINLFGGVTV